MEPRELILAIAEATKTDPHKTLALYVHIPFCSAKCHFCDWVVDVPVRRLRSGAHERQAYVQALCSQIRFYGPQLSHIGYRPQVMYWGGGTPTRLDPEEMAMIGDALDESFDLETLQQWSVETTPTDLTPEKLEAMQQIGVNRISIGVQSFNPDQLRLAGRSHSAEQAAAALTLIKQSGITNFNVDLIVGFPGEPLESLRATLLKALAFNPPHLSIYPYRATPATVMAMQLDRYGADALSYNQMVEAYEMAMALFREAGYYEYCHGYWVRDAAHEDQDGNYKYDLAGDKIGFGNGAESIIGHHLLWNKNIHYPQYMADPLRFSFCEPFSLTAPERFTASLGGALMTREGIDFARFQRLTGISFHEVRALPYIQRWFRYMENCGAIFHETEHHLYMDPKVIHTTYIAHLIYNTKNELAVERA